MQAFNYYNELYNKPKGRPITTPGRITGPVAQPGQAQTPASPALQGMQQSPYSGFMASLGQPIPFESQQQQRYNIARGQIQGGTRTVLEQMKTFMGGRGFRAGEAGIADAPLMQIATGGAQRLSQASTQIATDEALRKQQVDMMNLTRMLGGAQVGLAGEEGIQDRLLQYLALLSGSEQQRFQPYWAGTAQAWSS